MIPSARYFAKFHVLFHNKLLNRINSQAVAINPQLAKFIASCSEKKPGSWEKDGEICAARYLPELNPRESFEVLKCGMVASIFIFADAQLTLIVISAPIE